MLIQITRNMTVLSFTESVLAVNYRAIYQAPCSNWKKICCRILPYPREPRTFWDFDDARSFHGLVGLVTVGG